MKNRANNTVRGYIADIELLQRFFNLEDWSTFTEEMAVEYMKELKKAGKDTSVARKVYCFRGFWKFLQKKGVTSARPSDEIELHAIRRALPETLTIQEMNKLLTRIREPLPAFLGVPQTEMFLTVRDKAMLEVLYSAALRVSELVGLDWQDIDFAKREAQVLGRATKSAWCRSANQHLTLYLNMDRTINVGGERSLKARGLSFSHNGISE